MKKIIKIFISSGVVFLLTWFFNSSFSLKPYWLFGVTIMSVGYWILLSLRIIKLKYIKFIVIVSVLAGTGLFSFGTKYVYYSNICFTIALSIFILSLVYLLPEYIKKGTIEL